MAGFFGKSQYGTQMTTRGALEYRYNTARNQLIWVVAFSVINLVLQLVGANTYFLFSAVISYLLVDFGMAFCGKYPEEYYEGAYADYEFLDPSVLVVLAVIASLIIGLYLLFWFLARKQKYAWLIAALVVFAIDSAVVLLLLVGDPANWIIDLLFHAWVIYYLISGIRAALRLKNLPPEEEIIVDPNDPMQPPLDFSVEE